MNIKIVKLLTAICAVLIIIVIIEWVAAKFVQSRLLASIDSGKPQQLQIDQVPAIDLEGKAEQSYVDLVTRPLFLKGRRPLDETVPEENALPGSDVFDWQLNGVYTVKKELSALFSRAKTSVAKDNFRKLKENDDLDGWKLTEIQKDKVILQQGSEQKELLLRKPKLKELPKTPDQVRNQARPRGQAQRRNRNNQPPESQPPSAVDAPENSDNE